ncbi:hypothetical protein B0I35DRAFT_15391 [Stachybotrys elegans]|uniref:Uncharacterized protein n=1 Tax=Stachybotrys elegans TaxID=80388 RepID=A0A8K0T2T6_9HYPO|nr:hypothetical protein B0I35DRAFT_15391 [Stachybotrys elegans]
MSIPSLLSLLGWPVWWVISSLARNTPQILIPCGREVVITSEGILDIASSEHAFSTAKYDATQLILPKTKESGGRKKGKRSKGDQAMMTSILSWHRIFACHVNPFRSPWPCNTPSAIRPDPSCPGCQVDKIRS